MEHWSSLRGSTMEKGKDPFYSRSMYMAMHTAMPLFEIEK